MQTIAGRYELQELVGAGGMSSVFKARDTLLERNVALKILHEHFGSDEEYAERFRREARAVAQLSHPSIVTVIDRGEADGRHFIVFEYVEGRSLKELVEETGPLPVRRALEIALEVAGALAFAHRAGIVHRDVKPQNVLLNGDGKAKVTDFGIARSLDVEHGMTKTGTVLGTSNYIAPEQASGDIVSPQTDVYSLGVVLFELLTGKLPFEGENFVQIAMKHINESPPNVATLRPEVPPRVAAAVERALAKKPGDRFESMETFADELAACLAGLAEAPAGDDATMIVPRASAPRAPRAARSRRPLVALAAALIAAGGAAAVVVALVRGHGNGTNSPATVRPLPLKGLASYDPPPGDGREHDERVQDATDSDPATYWTTESYASDLPKPGVGLVLDGRRAGVLSQVEIATDTPGFTARVLAGNSRNGPFRIVSGTKSATGDSVYAIKSDRPARYWVIWITSLGGYDAVHVSEGRAR
jgi:eukaryotic-like serine/threonine-protein kinase